MRLAGSPARRFLRIGLGCAALASLVVVAVVTGLSLAYAGLTSGLPSLDLLPVLLDPAEGQLLQPTRLYDRSGEHLLLSLENPGIPRRYLPLTLDRPEHLSPVLVQVTIALAEPGFWQSPGFSWQKLTSPEPATLGERLALSLLLEGEPPGLRRALRMRLLAAQLTARYGRAQVLEWYLNTAYYGHLSYGVDNAAQLYLQKPASQLSLAEAALLAAVAEAPALNPLDAPAAALEIQQETLERLLAGGVIGSQEYQQARQENLLLRPKAAEAGQTANAFSNLVLDQLANELGRQRLERGGLKVLTTLDYDLQNQLACAGLAQLQRLQGQPSAAASSEDCPAARLLTTLPSSGAPLPEELAISGALLDLKSGQVAALLGDTTLAGGERPALSGHQPGSLLTPFVALTGFGRGLSPASLLWDIPESLPLKLAGFGNPDGAYHGPLRLRLAVANDYLVPLAQLLDQLGAANVWRLAEPLGLGGLGRQGDPQELILRGGRLTPLEIGQAYSAFANLGVLRGWRSLPEGSLLPVLVLQVEDPAGRILWGGEANEELAAISPQLAYLVHHILADETARWPSQGYPNPLEIGRPAGAKLGQTADGLDVWAAGYTPDYLAVIWSGLPAGSQQPVSLDPAVAAGVWHAILQYASRDLPAAGWSAPPGVSQLDVCDPSGKLPGPDCPTVVKEVFLNGNEPTEIDTLYRKLQVNRETGRLATVFTPLEMIEERVYLILPPEAQEWGRQAGVEIAPIYYDTLQPPPVSPGVEISEPPLFAYVRGQVTVRGSAGGEGFASYRLQAGQGLNPRNWLQIGPDGAAPVVNGELGVWDTQGLEGLYALRLVVLRQDQRLETAVIQVTVDNTPPSVEIPYPSSGQVLDSPPSQRLSLQAEVNDAVGVERVEWFIDGERIGERQEPPYVLVWDAVPGEHTLLVKAYDLAGNVGESQPTPFTLSGP